MQPSTIECVTFRANKHVLPEQFKTTQQVMEAFLNDQEGFIYRSLSCDNEGLWFDIVYRQSLAAAQAAAQKFMASDAAKVFMPLIDQQTVVIRHMSAISVHDSF